MMKDITAIVNDGKQGIADLAPTLKKVSPFDMTMTSKEIAEVTGKEHFHVTRDIRDLISTGAIDHSNFGEISLPDTYGRLQPGYRLDFKATLTLTTGYDSVRRAAVIQRWMKLEQGKATPAYQVPQSMSEALLLAGQLQAKIEADAPKVAFVEDVVEQSTGMMTLSDFGRVLKGTSEIDTGARKIFDQLRELDVIQKSWPLPYTEFIDRGYFVVNGTETPSRTGLITFVTGRGRLWIHGKLKEAFGPN